jgi:hypothetical protein
LVYIRKLIYLAITNDRNIAPMWLGLREDKEAAVL